MHTMGRFYFTNLPNLLFNFITITNIIYNKQENYDKITSRNRWNTHYDYVIVGAGTSGCVLASKLSEDPSVSVLLLEAGASETVSSNTPGLSDALLGSMMDWKFITVPQNESCLGMKDNQCMLSSGKVVGGSSSINRLYYFRGNPASFDTWESHFGLKDWSWKDIFPVFIRNENQIDPERAKSGYFGVSGPVSIEKSREHNPILESFVYASKLAGYRYVDLNTGVNQGTSILQSITRNGRRISMSTAFLEPNLKRPNLHILSNTLALNVLFEGNRAVGVKFYRNWKPQTVNANREVIISAGAINSPKLLMLSGVGPSDELRKHHIPIVADLPVGNNLHDHVGSHGLHFTTNQAELMMTKQDLKQYFHSGKGPLAENRYGATIFKLPDARQYKRNVNHTDSPNVMLLSFAGSLASKEMNAQLAEQRMHLNQDLWKALYKPMKDDKVHFTIMPVLLEPKSRGTVRLKSNNPLDPPRVDPAYFRNPQDLQLMVGALQEALHIVKKRPFKLLNTQIFKTVVPGCELYAPKMLLVTNVGDDKEKIIRKSSITGEMPTIMITSTMATTTERVSQANLFRRLFTRYKLKPRIKKSVANSETRARAKDNNDLWFDYFGAKPADVSKNDVSKYHLASDDSFVVDGYSTSDNNDQQNKAKPIASSTTRKPVTEMYYVSNSSVPIILVKANNRLSTTRAPSSKKPPSTTETPKTTQTASTTSTTTSNANKFVVYKNNHHNWMDESMSVTHWPSHTSSSSSSSTSSPSHHYHPHSLAKPSTSPPESSTPMSLEEEIPMLESPNEQVASSTQAPATPMPWSNYEHNHLEAVIDSLSPEYLRCMAQVLTVPMGDYVGTCRMGPDHDHQRVVDEHFRVVGVHNLRVVDASIVPQIVTGGAQPLAMMLGERAAVLIRDSSKKIRASR